MKQTVRGELVEPSSTVRAGQPVAYRNGWFDTVCDLLTTNGRLIR